jgi:uncharacterized membrane protein
MKITRNKLFWGILAFGLTVNLLVFFNIQYAYIRSISSFIFLATIPGLLIALILKLRKIGFWEYLVYAIGLSITFLMFGGLLINWALPMIGISQPLSLNPLSISLNFLLLTLYGIAYLRNKDISYEIKYTKLSWLNWAFFIFPIIFSVLSVLGAVSLNNRGSNIFTMIMLAGIALYVLLITILGKRLNPNIFPFGIFFIALSLLFMTSLRGWYITGHDIQQEYFVFQLTKNIFRWDISLFKDAYNACLSLNILPTIFSSYLNINDMYIYKVIFQIIFPFSVVAIFLAFKKYTNDTIAFLSVFLFVSFPTFLNDMPMLNRQEIALVFFSLMILVLFNKVFSWRLRNILFLIFGLSMIVSHYSTSYIAVALFTLTYLLSLLLKRKYINTKLKIYNSKYYLTWVMVTGIIMFTFIWNAQVTKTSGGLIRLAAKTWQNIGKSLSQDLKSGDVLYGLFSWQKPDTKALLKKYILEETKETLLDKNKDDYYDKSVYDKYKISILSEDTLPLTSLGNKLSRASINVFSLNYYFRQSTAKVIQILIIVGFIILVLRKSQNIKDLDPEYIALILIALLLLALLIILPLFSIEYGTLRFFQQTLIMLALPAVIGSLTIFNLLNKKIGLFLTLIMFIIFFLSLSGFIPQILGGYYPQLNLNNKGVYFDSYYTNKTEVVSIKWLYANYDNRYQIQSNSIASFKMLALVGQGSLGKILPVSILKNSYVYLDHTNVAKSENAIYYLGDLFIYDYPIDFLNQNKNLIYNNFGAKIYK